MNIINAIKEYIPQFNEKTSLLITENDIIFHDPELKQAFKDVPAPGFWPAFVRLFRKKAKVCWTKEMFVFSDPRSERLQTYGLDIDGRQFLLEAYYNPQKDILYVKSVMRLHVGETTPLDLEQFFKGEIVECEMNI